MSEVMKDFAIKLFGKTISFPNDRMVCGVSFSETSSTSQDSKDLSQNEFTGCKHENDSIDPSDETLSELTDEPTTPDLDKSSSSPKTPNKDEDEPSDESSGAQEKSALKKPDKLLPCPRCNSMDTKFCYYNNYNVSQPRHFCKKCQRYWTAGGTMRNVPVGSGRRKNKNSSVANYAHIMVQEAATNLKPNGFFIYGSDRSQNEFYENPSSTTSNSSGASFGPGFGPPAFPVTFYPSTPYWVPNSWNGPWPSLAQSPNLGKHSRENENNSEIISSKRAVLMPKTLRIDDPSEAAKSSIWSSLGIKNGNINVGSINGKSLFKAFESKGNVHNYVDNSKMVLQANPAALSRSVNFRESA